MQKNIEKEYKVLITKNEFEKLLETYPDHKVKDQTNYYFDTSPSLHEKNIAIRIRVCDNKYIFTLKHANEDGLSEYETELNEFNINDPKLDEIYRKFNIGELREIGKLRTLRHQADDKFGSLCIDMNEYNGITDYEVEYELFNPKEDRLGRFRNILAKAEIEYVQNSVSKIARMINTRKEGINMRAALFLADGFETCEAMISLDILKRAGINVDTCAITNTNEVRSGQGVRIFTDRVIADIKDNEYECIILPGGLPGAHNLQRCKTLEELILQFSKDEKLICAICAAPLILGELNLLNGRKATCYPGFEDKCLGAEMTGEKVVKDGNIITGKAMGATIEFAAKIAETLTDRETADKVIRDIYY